PAAPKGARRVRAGGHRKRSCRGSHLACGLPVLRHGHVPGRDFRLALHAAAGARTVRVEVTDTRAERLPRRPGPPQGAAGAEESGRGLLLVAHLAARWGWHPRPDGPGKTVWAEYAGPGPAVN
ncbi:ATP-binding protein, partial [Streptomyces sp. NPDC057197]|uniref:ATP-binding protein n=1 Tax=Streptomyces sp. NPDC057197 TaxID=3346045 RepID=UPI0036455E3F